MSFGYTGDGRGQPVHTREVGDHGAKSDEYDRVGIRRIL